jgi:energy-coupling factor transporter ATP-binding protein EcfA2
VTSVRRPHSFDEPFGWWGPVWASPATHTIGDLVRDGILTAESAALLWVLLERRASLVVAAGPSGAGKTTLLTALLDFLPAETRRIYVRGCYEPFDFLGSTEPATSALLVNELSPHLPIYLWGPGVRTTLAAVRDGYQLMATAHALSVDEFVFSLAGYPLRVPAAEIAAVDLLVLLDAWLDGRGVRREVRTIVHLAAGTEPGSLAPVVLAERARRGGALVVDRAIVGTLFERLGGDSSTLWTEIESRSRQIGAPANDLAES